MGKKFFTLLMTVMVSVVCIAGFTGIVFAASSDPTVYVNGSTGSDDNTGTKDEPVKTFQKAKELLESQHADAIYVTGALTVSTDSETWDLDGKSLVRDPDYHGTLVKIGQGRNLTLTDIVIDGNSSNGASGVKSSYNNSGSLISIRGGGNDNDPTLTVGEGAVLKDNTISSTGSWYPDSGGAVYASNAKVYIEGGTITNNETVWGGGIYATGPSSKVIMSDGSITGNRAIDGTISSSNVSRSYGGSGGGICLMSGADMEFSGGTISNNSAAERGGGISLATSYGASYDSPELTMTGGTIDGNTAGAAGGGIFVQAGYSASGNNGKPTYAIATISGGTLTNNKMTGKGKGNDAFGGGAIYVNGFSRSESGFHNGELYLSNAEITDNQAKIAGGGYAACPVSETKIVLKNGVAIYGNSSEEAKDIYILASYAYGAHSGNPKYEISPSMLGGGAYRWCYENGNEVPLNKLSGYLRAIFQQELRLHTNVTSDDPGVKKAHSLAKVFITGNTSSTRGGGIGSNGSVFVGTGTETTQVSVTKTWVDANDSDDVRPSDVKVELYRNGEYVGYRSVSADENGTWTATFGNLPKADSEGNDYVYTVKERSVDGYSSQVSGSASTGYTIKNTRTVDIPVTKKWVGPKESAVTVHLYANGADTGKTLALNADNDWTQSFSDLAKYDSEGSEISYTVAEDVPANYSVSITGDVSSGFTITNTNTETIDISVQKKWVGTAAGPVTIHLLANGADTGQTLVLSEDNNWQGSFTGLSKYADDGSQITYSITEDEVDGYVSAITGSADEGFVVTNTKKSFAVASSLKTTDDESGDTGESESGTAASEAESSTPDTGDSTSMTLGLLALASAAVAAAAVSRRRARRNE
jgi:hypothetical protein